ncbi:efflux RND transporter periplasmic adaptor subunit [Puniceicoccaceae bacterium K14]|nr:efflux RND transporter periplasmic adaptor subunit [Puniceicoccaceae bacterium K14]
MKFPKKVIPLLIPLLIIASGLIAAKIIIESREEPSRSIAADSTPVVTVATVRAESIQPKIEAYGHVTPHREAEIQAQLSGVTIAIDNRLVIGGQFQSEDELLRIQPVDFEIAVNQREAELAKARTELEQEQGRQVIAKREWEFLGLKQPVDEISKRLALREPQLKQAQIALKAAESSLKQAQINLERTVIRSPFNATVISESAEKGQLVAAGEQICRLVCTDQFYVIASVPLWLVPDISTTEEDGEGTIARIYINDTPTRKGRVIRFLPNLEAKSRMARLVVAVDDPLALQDENKGRGKLFIDSYVRLKIDGPEITDAIRLPRAYVRANDTAWVIKDSKLEIRPLEIRYREAEHLIVTGGLQSGDRIITSSLSVVTHGMALRMEDSE